MTASTRKAARELKAAMKQLGEQARRVAKKAGATKTVTIYKGVTISKDKPAKVKP
jgi:hypothetical protein